MDQTKSSDDTGLQVSVNGDSIGYDIKSVRSELVNGMLNIAVNSNTGKYLIEVSVDYSKIKNNSVADKDYKLQVLFSPFQAGPCIDNDFKNTNNYNIIDYSAQPGSPFTIELDASVSCSGNITAIKGIIHTKMPKQSFIGNDSP